MLEIKTAQLNEQQTALDTAQLTLVEREKELETANATLVGKQEEVAQIQIQLDSQQAELNAAQLSLNQATSQLEQKQSEQIILQTTLDQQATKLTAMQALLDAKQIQIDNQSSLLQSQKQRIDNLIGVKSEIIQDLSAALTNANLKANVDENTGDITLESQVLFSSSSFDIKGSGKELLDNFLPVYLDVLMRPEYIDFVGEIVIEGHTDTDGSYMFNLELSQDRALGVAKYCLQMPGLSFEQKSHLQSILTAKGRSYSDLIYNQDGTVNMDACRRVEFKFSLKDAEMIQEMNAILTSMKE